MRNLPANIVSEIVVKVQFTTHEEWQQDLGNGLTLLYRVRTYNTAFVLTDLNQGPPSPQSNICSYALE